MKKILITLELEVSDDFGSSKLDVVQDDVIDGIVLFRKDWEETRFWCKNKINMI